MIVAALMVVFLYLVVLLLREVIKAEQPGSPQKLGFFAYKDDKDQPTKHKFNKGSPDA